MRSLPLKTLTAAIEAKAPPALQESYDNSGLQTGDPDMEIKGVLITFDFTEACIQEALEKDCNLIIAHHPLTLSGFKRITGKSAAERILMQAIRHNLALYTAHTNIDSVVGGVSSILADKLSLIKQRILEPRGNSLLKLVVFVPESHADKLRQALFEAGGGRIGAYDRCSFNLSGTGTFRGDADTRPFVGTPGQTHAEAEVRIETILPAFHQQQVVEALLSAHPYEEPAYDLYPLHNNWDQAGFGVIGQLPKPQSTQSFLEHLKQVSGTGCVRHTRALKDQVQTIAVCGGSGSFLLNKAIAQKADVYVSGDFKYHQFFDAEGEIVIADIGHYESERFVKEVFFELLTKKFPNFAVRLSEQSSNPIKYL